MLTGRSLTPEAALFWPSINHFPTEITAPQKNPLYTEQFPPHSLAVQTPLWFGHKAFSHLKEALATCSSLSHLANSRQANGGKWKSLSGCSHRGPWISLPYSLSSSHCNTLLTGGITCISVKGTRVQSHSQRTNSNPISMSLSG